MTKKELVICVMELGKVLERENGRLRKMCASDPKTDTALELYFYRTVLRLNAEEELGFYAKMKKKGEAPQ